MWGRARHKAAPEPGGPILDLSGPRLREVFEHLVEAAEPAGGIERDVGHLRLKSSLFGELHGEGRVSALTEAEFPDLCGFIAPVRRRLGLDAIATERGRTRLKLVEGAARALDEPARLGGPR